jgi:Lipid A core - O-antigen ligase and related enzymes
MDNTIVIKLLILFFIFAVAIIRCFFAYKKKNSSKYLLISCFVQTIPFNISSILYNYSQIPPLGEFGSKISIDSSFLFCGIFLLLGLSKLKSDIFSWEKNKWLYIFIIFSIISFFNPINPFIESVFVPLFFLIQLILLLKIIEANFTKDEIFRGIYDGLAITTIVQCFLAICFPILGMEFMASIFRGDRALEVTYKREDYVSAVGTFSHPGDLSLYVTLLLTFLLNCYFNGYKKMISLFLILMNLFVLYLTFSRTSFAISISVMFFVFLANRNRNIFSLKNILLGFLFLLAVFIIFMYVPVLNNLFFQSDVDLQTGNRLMHWFIGIEIWEESQWIGLGINSHVYYMYHFIKSEIEFFVVNPVHNIHIIALAETGIVGFSFWIYYFISRIYKFSQPESISQPEQIMSKTCAGLLFAYFFYGFFGWAPFKKELLTLLIFFLYLAPLGRTFLLKQDKSL